MSLFFSLFVVVHCVDWGMQIRVDYKGQRHKRGGRRSQSRQRVRLRLMKEMNLKNLLLLKQKLIVHVIATLNGYLASLAAQLSVSN